MAKVSDNLFSRIFRDRALTDSLMHTPEMGRLPFETADSLNERALRARESGRPEEAEKLWRMALMKDPRHAESLFNRGLLLLRAGRMTGADVLADLQKIEGPKGRELTEAALGEIGPEPLPTMIRVNTCLVNGPDRIIGFRALQDEMVMLINMEDLYIFGARYKRDTGRQLWFDTQGHGLASGVRFRGAAIRPDGKRSAHLFENGLIQIYNMETGEIEITLQGLKPVPREGKEDVSLIYSQDGKQLVVGEPPCSELPAGRTTLFELADPDHLKRTVTTFSLVCMSPDHGCVVRGKSAWRETEGLFILDPDGNTREVFRFERKLKEIREYQLEPAPFLCYAYQETGEKFMIDISFRKHSMTEEMFAETENAPFYDPDHHRLYTWEAEGKLALWDLETSEKLNSEAFSGKKWRDQKQPWPREEKEIRSSPAYPGSVEFAGGQWQICLGSFGLMNSRSNQWHWETRTLPSWWVQKPADWKRSPGTTAQETGANRRRADLLEKVLIDCLQRGTMAECFRYWKEYCRIPETYGTEAYASLENALDQSAEKGILLSVREMGETAPPADFVMTRDHELTLLPDGRLLLCKTHAPGTSVRVCAADGTLLKKLPVPPGTAFAAFRKGKIYAFSPFTDCILMDPEGRLLPLPWEDWPQEKDYYDLNPEGNVLIYMETKYGFGKKIKNLDTGVEHPYDTKSRINSRFLPPRFLANGTIAGCRDNWYVVLYNPENGEKIREYQADCHLLTTDPERRRIFCREFGEKEGKWTLLDVELHFQAEWRDEGGPADYVFIPGTGLMAHCTKTGLQIRDTKSGKQVFTARGREFGQLCVRADGRELYVRDGDMSRAFRLEYDYAEGEAGKG